MFVMVMPLLFGGLLKGGRFAGTWHQQLLHVVSHLDERPPGRQGRIWQLLLCREEIEELRKVLKVVEANDKKKLTSQHQRYLL